MSNIRYVYAICDLDEMEAELEPGFELEFVDIHCKRIEKYGDNTTFSPKQQTVIHNLITKYMGEEYTAGYLVKPRLEE